MRLIDADALIEKAHHEAKGMSKPFKEQFGVLVEWLVEKTPTIEQKPKWIPVTERLPEDDQEVLTQMPNGGMQVDWLIADKELRRDGSLWFWADEIDEQPVAWRPLPEPYKEKP